MKKYVLAFIFTKDMENVWLIQKNRPNWQKGKLNGIGGKIEPGETPKEAILREVHEESGVDLSSNESFQFIGDLSNDSFHMDVFACVSDEYLVTMEDETVLLIPVSELSDLLCIDNVPALIELSLLKINGDGFFDKFSIKMNDPQ